MRISSLVNRRGRGESREDFRFNYEEHEGHEEKAKFSQRAQGTQSKDSCLWHYGDRLKVCP